MFLGILPEEKQTQFRSAPGLVRGLPVIVATAKRSGKHPASYNFALEKSQFQSPKLLVPVIVFWFKIEVFSIENAIKEKMIYLLSLYRYDLRGTCFELSPERISAGFLLLARVKTRKGN